MHEKKEQLLAPAIQTPWAQCCPTFQHWCSHAKGYVRYSNYWDVYCDRGESQGDLKIRKGLFPYLRAAVWLRQSWKVRQDWAQHPFQLISWGNSIGEAKTTSIASRSFTLIALLYFSALQITQLSCSFMSFSSHFPPNYHNSIISPWRWMDLVADVLFFLCSRL